MKNIYVLPTDKPSRLFNCFGKLEIGEFCATREDLQVTNQHIYITSTEEIMDCNCYVINVIGDEDTKRYVFKPIEVTEDYVRKEPMVTYPSGGWCEKVVLTTDPDLINDGVQSIPDEFLEWFVDNPTFDNVELKPWFNEILSCCKSESECFCNKKRIVLPNDEYIYKIDNKNLLYSMQDLEDAWENGYSSYEEEISGRKYTFEQWFNSIKKITK